MPELEALLPRDIKPNISPRWATLHDKTTPRKRERRGERSRCTIVKRIWYLQNRRVVLVVNQPKIVLIIAPKSLMRNTAMQAK